MVLHLDALESTSVGQRVSLLSYAELENEGICCLLFVHGSHRHCQLNTISFHPGFCFLTLHLAESFLHLLDQPDWITACSEKEPLQKHMKKPVNGKAR